MAREAMKEVPAHFNSKRVLHMQAVTVQLAYVYCGERRGTTRGCSRPGVNNFRLIARTLPHHASQESTACGTATRVKVGEEATCVPHYETWATRAHPFWVAKPVRLVQRERQVQLSQLTQLKQIMQQRRYSYMLRLVQLLWQGQHVPPFEFTRDVWLMQHVQHVWAYWVVHKSKLMHPEQYTQQNAEQCKRFGEKHDAELVVQPGSERQLKSGNAKINRGVQPVNNAVQHVESVLQQVNSGVQPGDSMVQHVDNTMHQGVATWCDAVQCCAVQREATWCDAVKCCAMQREATWCDTVQDLAIQDSRDSINWIS